MGGFGGVTPLQFLMTLCLLPSCNTYAQRRGDRYCSNCGTSLLLKDCYRPIRSIGEGGFGRTFLAEDLSRADRPNCVIKQLSQRRDLQVNRQAQRMFRQEAMRLQQLGDHPQIPRLLDHFEQGNYRYLVQQHIDGWDLQSELQTQGPFHEDQIWQLLLEVSSILRFVHERRIIHRDIKPRNIMRRREGGGLVLIDFGVAKLLKPDGLKQSRTLVGSPEYMAPEQTQGKVFDSSDLYSLGVTCLYLLTGRSPLELYSPAYEVWYWREALPEGRGGVSDRLEAVLDRLLKTEVEERFTSAKALNFHLLACQSIRQLGSLPPLAE
jgi:serine/threonine protein kinase